jgi:hypothetical protein
MAEAVEEKLLMSQTADEKLQTAMPGAAEEKLQTLMSEAAD